MNTSVRIHDGSLPAAEPWRVDGAGAVICFEGVVRQMEEGRSISGLRYETYDPMAERELQHLAEESVGQFDILAVRVEHSRGFVPNHACSFRLQIASAHRKQGLAAMDWFIDRMKQAVPIWKHPISADPSQETPR
jgi:molybdopterin synthase catalytic subunit